MTSIRVAILAASAACAAFIVHAQEQAASVSAPPDEAALQKRCTEKADHDKMRDNLRPTFMLECVANAKLDAPQKPAEQK